MTGMIRSYIALLCVLLLLRPPAVSRRTRRRPADPAPGSQRPMKEESGIFGRITGPYRAAVLPQNNLNNSTRIESLLRAGNLYLSLQDAIALALENNLDIAIQRYASDDRRYVGADRGGGRFRARRFHQRDGGPEQRVGEQRRHGGGHYAERHRGIEQRVFERGGRQRGAGLRSRRSRAWIRC